jgi:hypothetical protein
MEANVHGSGTDAISRRNTNNFHGRTAIPKRHLSVKLGLFPSLARKRLLIEFLSQDRQVKCADRNRPGILPRPVREISDRVKRNGALEQTSHLTAQEVRKRIEAKSRWDFSEFHSMDDGAARLLAGQSHHLDLSGLTDLTDSVAAELARHEGDLDLSGLKSLSDSVAKWLSTHAGDLMLDGLESLSDAAAQELSHTAGCLSLRGLSSFDSSSGHLALAHKLTEQNNDELCLNRLESVSDEVAAVLALHSGELDFAECRIRNLTDGPGHLALVARMAETGENLRLRELSYLSLEVARILARHQGELALPSIKLLSDPAAEALAAHNGKLHLPALTQLRSAPLAARLAQSTDFLHFFWLNLISADAAAALAPHCGTLTFEKLLVRDEDAAQLARYHGVLEIRQLICAFPDSPGLLALIEKLSQNGQEGSFQLLNASTLSDDGAAALARFRGDVDMSELVTLTETAADALARHRGELNLSGIGELSDHAALSLSRHEGTLNLGGIQSLQDVPGHLALMRNPNVQFGRIVSLGDQVAGLLTKRVGDFDLSALATLNDSPGHVELAKTLAEQDQVDLSGLTSLGDSAATALASHRGSLLLSRLNSLSDRGAAALARHQGNLFMESELGFPDSGGFRLLKSRCRPCDQWPL